MLQKQTHNYYLHPSACESGQGKGPEDLHQYEFAEGRSFPEPTRTIIDIMRWAKEKKEPLLVLSTDLYKVFDFESMTFYGFLTSLLCRRYAHATKR